MTDSRPAATWEKTRESIASAPAGASVGVTVRMLETGATFDAGGDRIFPAASTIKLLILVGLARALDEGRLCLDDRAPVLASQKVGGSGVLNWLEPELSLTLQDHAWLMTAISDNTASNVLIDAVGLPAIHEVQTSLGLAGTSLNRRFLGRAPASGDPENVASARDLVTVLAAIAGDTAASPERCAWMRGVLADQQIRDRLARYLPESITFAGKSGWLSGISHDSGLLTGTGGTAAVAVLTEGIVDRHVAADLIGRVGLAVVEDLQIA